MNVNPADGQTASQNRVTDSLQPSASDALAGTAWRLVQIVSMDNRVDVLDDRSLFTLEFNYRVRADAREMTGCNPDRAFAVFTFGDYRHERSFHIR